MSLEEANMAFIKESTHLMYHSLGRSDKLNQERACLTQLKGNNIILHMQLKEHDTNLPKELKANDSDILFLKKRGQRSKENAQNYE